MRKLRIPPPRGISKASRVIFSVLTLLFLSIGQVWGADIIIDLDLSKGTTYPTGFPTATGTTSGTYKFGGYDFSFLTYDGLYFNSGGYLMVGKSGYNSEASASYIAFPAISGYKLKEVFISTTSNGSTNVSVSIRSNYSTTLTGGTAWVYAQSTTHTWTLSNTSDNTSYRMYFQRKASGNTVNAQLASLKLTYEPAGSTTPSVTPSPTSLTFDATVAGGNAPDAKTFTITGSNLTGNLSLSESTGADYYTWEVTNGSLTPTAGAVSAIVTVTPKSSIAESAGVKEGTITISGGGASNVSVALSTTVTAPPHSYTYNKAFTSTTIPDWSSSWDNGYSTAHTVNFDIYNEHAGNDCHVYFAGASKQTTTITDKPVAKNGAVNLILDDPNKYISAVKFVGEQWGTKAQTMVLKYSTDGGESWTAFDPAKEAANFVIEELNLPAKVNAVQVAGKNSNNQIGYASVHFDLVDKVTYSIGKDETGCTLSVTDGTSAITSAEEGDEVYVSIASTETGYENAGFVVKDAENNTITVTAGKFTMPDKAVTITATATKKQYIVTLSATNGKIQVGGVDKESITVAHGETAQLTAVADAGYNFNGWTSSDGTKVALSGANANPVTITVTGAATVTANFVSASKLNPGFAWSAASAEAVKGQAASLPTLSANPYSLTPTYVSTNTDVAEISSAGVVTVKAVGSTTIKATYAEDGTYAACEAAYTLTVKGRVTWHIIKDGVDNPETADYAKDAVPTKPTPASCHSSISLVGWTTSEYAKSDDEPATLYTGDVPAVTDNAEYYAVWAVVGEDSEASITEGVDTDGLIDGNDWTTGGSGMGTYTSHGLKFTAVGGYLQSPDITSENIKTVVVKFSAGANSSTGSIFTIASYADGDELIDSKTCTPDINYNDQNDYSYTLSGSSTIKYVKITLTTRTVNVGLEYAELFKVIAGSTTGYTTNCVEPMTVATPTFTPDGSAAYYTEAQNVTINCATEGSVIYYTLDNTTPSKTNGTQYTAAINVAETKTIKAIAYVGDVASEVATATFTLSLSTMDQIYAAATAIGGTAQERVITFNNWVVSGVKDATAYVTDGEKGFIIYTTATGNHGLAVNDKISGTVTCQLKLYNKAAQVVGLAKSDITTAGGSVTNDGVITPIAKTIASLGGVNTGAPVIISNVTYNSSNQTLVDGDENAIKPYTTLFNYGSTFENNKIYTVTGIYLQYGESTKEILPRKAEDIVLESKEQQTITWYVDNNKVETIGTSYSLDNKDVAFAPVCESNSTGARTYQSSDPTVATINENTGVIKVLGNGVTTITCNVVGDENYVDGSKAFTLKVGIGEASWVATTWATDNSIAANAKMADNSPIAIDANISMTWAKAEGSNDPIYHSDGEGRLYQKNTLTFTAANSKQITRIEFHFTGTSTGNISANEGTYSAGVWEGFAPSVTFTNAQGASGAKIKSIDIEYAQGTTTTLEIADMIILNNASATDIVFTSNKPGAVVTYSDYDEDVITIAEGKVTPVAIGNTTVKASIAAEAPYSSVSITFNVRVKSSTETVENVVILSQFGGGWIAMKHDFTAVAVDKATDGTILDLTCDEADITWVMTADGASAMFQQPGTNKYLALGSSHALTLVDDPTTWTLSDDGYYYKETGRTFLYQGSGGKYKSYAASNHGKSADGGYSEYATFVTSVFANRAEIRTAGISSGVWGTICPKKEVKYPAGASFFEISYVEYHSGVPYKVFYDEIAEDASLEAGHPYLFQADEESTAIKGIAVGDDATSAINDHGFKGVLENETISVVTADVENYRYYIVYNNEIRLCGEGQFLIRAERAYLDMSDPEVEKQYKAPINGRRRVALTNNAPQVATGMDELNASEAPVKVMIDGKFYILRGEKMYDATGKLVK